MKRNILINSAGVATVWHLASLIKTDFSDYFTLFLSDINPPHLVPSSILSDKFITVPFIKSVGYRDYILNLFDDLEINVFVPLIDEEIFMFPKDDPELIEREIISSSVISKSVNLLNNKAKWSEYLDSKEIRVPRIFNDVNLPKETFFFIKPVMGFGSRGSFKATYDEAFSYLSNGSYVVQELCEGPEITIEVYNENGVVKSLCRERLEVKAGVCTKARIWHDPELDELAVRICSVIELPLAFCFQVMYNISGQFVVTDINPRLGAGTSLSSRYGWHLASAFLSNLAGKKEDRSKYFHLQNEEKYVTRVYQDILMN
jgi:hypothetical protein